ncbi:MAG: DUF2911 domain-containing protein [Saprospiraceae bacterium]|nr:DUF2911 domain-containing protein [Saprospiraceae bacterium]
MRRFFALTIALTWTTLTALAQIVTPSPSPSSTFTQTVGLTKITVEYSRPSIKERVVFGDAGDQSLEKYNQPWRTGANTATKFTFSDDVKIAGKNLAKGAYSIITVPGKTQWKIQFFPYDSGQWTYYTDKTPVLEAPIAVQKNGEKVETIHH